MARHRLLAAKRRRKSYTRVDPTGVMYHMLYTRIWISPPAAVMNCPAIFTDHDHSPL